MTSSAVPAQVVREPRAVELHEHRGIAAAIDRAQAVIEFDLSGHVLAANQNFLDTVGYTLEEIQGKHHRIFCDPADAGTGEYAQFWASLGAGAFEGGEYRRLAKGGREVWLQATYNPILGPDGTPTKIVKFASDITESKNRNAEFTGKIAAIDRGQAVIEFDLSGRVLTANKNFLDVMGYTLDEIQGKHHRMFCDPAYTTTSDYAAFWTHLGGGAFEGGEYRRLARGGREVWLQATYNPIIGPDGRPIKIVKFASDITESKNRTAEFVGKVAAIDRAQAVIEFDLGGHVLTANQNFLDVMGYTLTEIQGQHHRTFCDPAYAASSDYTAFWMQLGAGQFASGEYKRLAKGGREVYIQATYNPILDMAGRPVKIVKFAVDVTQAKMCNVEVEARVGAIDRAQAIIEFDPEGIVLAANENFLRTMGYTAREIIGQHHSTLCTEEYKRSVEYRDFWLRLAKGELIGGRFHRQGKYGRDVHIEATYNPILDLAGNVAKIVKYAHDVTDRVQREQRIDEGTKAMTTSVAHLASSIEEIAQSSQTASQLAEETHGNAEQGVQALRASLEAIALIQKSSISIAEIVRVMGDIANQTNLLAFNASIEAARAGEHGIGFSIVAGEVRKLAERSFEAAQQIGKLVEESAERVHQGSEVSKRAEGAFERIVESVGRTNNVIRTISSSTQVQQETSREVDRLIAQLSDGA